MGIFWIVQISQHFVHYFIIGGLGLRDFILYKKLILFSLPEVSVHGSDIRVVS